MESTASIVPEHNDMKADISNTCRILGKLANLWKLNNTLPNHQNMKKMKEIFRWMNMAMQHIKIYR